MSETKKYTIACSMVCFLLTLMSILVLLMKIYMYKTFGVSCI